MMIEDHCYLRKCIRQKELQKYLDMYMMPNLYHQINYEHQSSQLVYESVLRKEALMIRAPTN